MKKAIWIIIILFILSNGYLIYTNYDLKNENSYLEDKKNDLENKVKDLEDEIEELKSDYKETLTENEEYLNSQKEQLIPDFQETEYVNTTEQNTSNYSPPKSNINKLDISIPYSIQTINFDQGKLISPSLENLHFLFSLSEYDFERVMTNNDYSLTTTKESFVNNSTRNCCFTIDKDMQSITMMYTKSVNNNIETILNYNNINYTYDDAFKRYIYQFNNQRFVLYIQTGSDKLILLLKNI
jgi:uncharacterized protein YxeA